MLNITDNFSLQHITTLHLPVKCKHFVEYDSIESLHEVLNSPITKDQRMMQIGGGSNLVFTADFDGTILHSAIKFINVVSETPDEIILEVGSGVVWDEFVKHCVAHNYSGIENLSYIPGEVGASAVQNIGSYGAEVKDVITRVHCIEIATGEARTFTNKECQYAYRYSIFKGELKDKFIVTSVEYRLSKHPSFNLEYGALKNLQGVADVTLSKVRDEIISIRCSKLPDPKEIGSVGSFFKNPIISAKQFEEFQAKYPDAPHYAAGEGLVKVPAGWLIEHAGLKGHSVGGAQVYEKQCLVIVNANNATSTDIVNLYTHIIDVVKSTYGIEISPEANII